MNKLSSPILVINSDTEALLRFRSAMSEEGIRVMTATTVDSACRRVLDERPAAVESVVRQPTMLVSGGNGNNGGVARGTALLATPTTATATAVMEQPKQEVELPGLVVIALNLPEGGPLDISRRLQDRFRVDDFPLWVWGSSGQESSVVQTLMAGADDYLPPYEPPQITAGRIQALLRREKRRSNGSAGGQNHLLVRGRITIDLERHIVRVNDNRIDLTKTEFKLLWQLLRRPGRVFTRAQLLDICCGEASLSVDRTIDVHIHSLRKKLGGSGAVVETVRGVGYRVKEESV